MKRSLCWMSRGSKVHTFWRSLESTITMEKAYRTDQAFQSTDERPFTLSEIVRRMLKVRSRCEKAKLEADDKEYTLLRGEYKYFSGKKLDVRSASPAELIAFLQCCVYFGFFDTHAIDLCLEEIELKAEGMLPNEIYHLLIVLPKLPSKSEGNLHDNGQEDGAFSHSLGARGGDHFARVAADALLLQQAAAPSAGGDSGVKGSAKAAFLVSPASYSHRRTLRDHPAKEFDNCAEHHRREVQKSHQFYLLSGRFFSGLCDRAVEWMEASEEDYLARQPEGSGVEGALLGPLFACYSMVEQIDLLSSLKPGDSPRLFGKLLKNLYTAAMAPQPASEDGDPAASSPSPPLCEYFKQCPSSLVAVLEGVAAFLPPLLHSESALHEKIRDTKSRLELTRSEHVRTPKGYRHLADRAKEISAELEQLRAEESHLRDEREVMLDMIQICVEVAFRDADSITVFLRPNSSPLGSKTLSTTDFELNGLDEVETNISFADVDAAVASAAEEEARATDPEYRVSLRSTLDVGGISASTIPHLSANKMENTFYAKKDPLAIRRPKTVGPTLPSTEGSPQFVSRLSPQDIASLSLCIVHLSESCFSARLHTQYDDDLSKLPAWLVDLTPSSSRLPSRIPLTRYVRALQKAYMAKQTQWCSDSLAAMMSTVHRTCRCATDIASQCHTQLTNSTQKRGGATRELSQVLNEATKVTPLAFYSFLSACQVRVNFFSTSFSSGELANVTAMYLSCLTEASALRAHYEVGMAEAWRDAFQMQLAAAKDHPPSPPACAPATSSSLLSRLRLSSLPGASSTGEEQIKTKGGEWREAFFTSRTGRPDALVATDRFNSVATTLSGLLEEASIHFSHYNGYGKRGVTAGSWGGSGGAEDGAVVALVLLEAMADAAATLERHTQDVRAAKAVNERLTQTAAEGGTCSVSGTKLVVAVASITTSEMRPLQLPLPSPFPPRQHWQLLLHRLGVVVVQTCPFYSLDECLTVLSIAGRLRFAMLDAAITATIVRLQEVIPIAFDGLDDLPEGPSDPSRTGSSAAMSSEVRRARASQLQKAEAAQLLLRFIEGIRKQDEEEGHSADSEQGEGDGDASLVLAPHHVTKLRQVVTPLVKKYAL